MGLTEEISVVIQCCDQQVDQADIYTGHDGVEGELEHAAGLQEHRKTGHCQEDTEREILEPYIQTVGYWYRE